MAISDGRVSIYLARLTEISPIGNSMVGLVIIMKSSPETELDYMPNVATAIVTAIRDTIRRELNQPDQTD